MRDRQADLDDLTSCSASFSLMCLAKSFAIMVLSALNLRRILLTLSMPICPQNLSVQTLTHLDKSAALMAAAASTMVCGVPF